jgi:transcriptional regulator with XRE-family HTH domain
MALGDLVRWRRSQLGLTQEEIAGRDPLGKFTQAEISQYEKHKVSRSSRQKMERLAEALGLPYDLVTAATYQPLAEDDRVEEFVRRWYAQRTDASQLPLEVTATPHEEILADLLAMAQKRPDLMETIRALRAENTEETYRQALAIIWRHMVSGLETARDLLSTDPQGKQKV